MGAKLNEQTGRAVRPRPHPSRGWARAGLLGVCSMLAVGMGAAPAQAITSSQQTVSLVFPAAELAVFGFHPATAGVAAARRKLEAGLPRASMRLLAGASVQACAGKTTGGVLSFDAVVLDTASAAGTVLADWRRVHRAPSVAIGSGGAVWARLTKHRAVVEVLWRDRSRLGLVTLDVTSERSTARTGAVAYARLADPSLRASLPTTAWGKVLAEIRPNGSVSERTALQAFALSYGPLPGVTVPSGRRGTIESGDLAMNWVLPLLPRLSQRLRAAIYQDLGISHARDHRAHAARLPNFGDPNFHPSEMLTDDANYWAGLEGNASHLNYALDAKLTIVVGTAKWAGDAYEDSDAVNASGRSSPDGPYCEIRVSSALEETFAVNSLAHEVFHCFEFALDPDASLESGWVAEGMAEWAALSVDASYRREAIEQYAQTPGRPLYERTYDAAGFWGHLQDTLGGLWNWHRVQAILAEHDDDDAFVAAVPTTTGQGFLDTWGSSFFDLPSGGSAWEMVDPVGPQAQAPIMDLAAGSAATADLYVPAYATGQYFVHADAAKPLIFVNIGAPPCDPSCGDLARLAVGSNYTDLDGAWFCTADSCDCPAGSPASTPDYRHLSSSGEDLGVTGISPDGTAGDITYYSLDEYCNGPPPLGWGGKAPSGGAPPPSRPLHSAQSCTTIGFPGLTSELQNDEGAPPGQLADTGCGLYDEDSNLEFTNVLAVYTSVAEAKEEYGSYGPGSPDVITPISGVGDKAAIFTDTSGNQFGGVVLAGNDICEIYNGATDLDVRTLLEQCEAQLK